MKYKPAFMLLSAATALFVSAIVADADPPTAAKAALAPDATPTQITGTVATPDGKPVAGADVTLDIYDYRRSVVSSALIVKTDQAGTFTFPLTAPNILNGIFAEFFVSTPDGFGSSEWRNQSTTNITIEPLTSVNVHFVGVDGKPVPNLEVLPRYLFSHQGFATILSKNLTPQWAQSTDATGTVTMTGLPQGYNFTMDIDGAQFAPLDNYGQVTLASTATTPDVTFRLAPACSISGRVMLPETNGPAANVRITAYPAIRNQQSGDAVTDANGHYSIPRLAAGTYTIEVDGRMVSGRPCTAPAQTVILSSTSNSANCDIPLVKGARIVGTVRDKASGKPLSGVLVILNGPAHPSNSGGADRNQTGQDGRFEFFVPGGEQDLIALDESNSSNNARQSFVVADAGLHYVDISMTAPVVVARVTGIVLGPDGKPAAGAEVLAGIQNPGMGTTTCDSAGRFTFDRPGVPVKTLIYAHSGDLYTSGGTATGGNGDIVLHLAGGNSVSFKGSVKDESGRPIANAAVSLVRSIPVLGVGTYSHTATTDATGNYSLGPDYSGFDYSVNVTAAGYADGYTKQVTGTAGKLLELPDLTIAKADSFVGGTIVDPQGNPVASAVVSLMSDHERQVTTDSTGRFHFDGVSRNKVILQVTAPDQRSASIQESSGTDADVIKVQNMAEITAAGAKFEAKVDADHTNHGDGTDAYKLLKTAEAQAAAGGKQVLLVFHASWCGPCFMLHTFLEDPKVKPVIDAHFVVQDLDIWEHGKNNWENPGGTAIYKKYGGPNSVPYFVVLDKSGKKLGSSIYQGDNMGMPSAPGDTSFFLSTLKSAAPTLSAAEEAILRVGLKRTADAF